MPRNSMEAFHDFFHSTKDSRPMSGKANYWYHGKVLLSYNTVIAQKEAADNGTNVVFVSIDNFTSTTTQHILSIRQAAPKDWALLEYPFMRDNSDPLSLDDFRNGYVKALMDFTEKDMKSLDTRTRYSDLLASWEKFRKLFGMDSVKELDDHVKELEPVRRRFEEKRRKLVESKRTERRKTPDEKAKARQDRIDRLVQRFEKLGIDKLPSGELARTIPSLPTTDGFRDKLEKWHFMNGCRYLVPAYETAPWYMAHDRPLSFREFLENPPEKLKDRTRLAFAWVEGRLVKTSLGVGVSVNHIRAAFEKFDSLKDKKRFEDYSVAGRYRVIHVYPEGLVIGCHVIPIENINELRKEVTEDGKE